MSAKPGSGFGCRPWGHKEAIVQINNVADLIAETLIQIGVKRVFGVVGDSLNGLTEALRRREAIDWIHVRHEEMAAFAAAGEAQVTGGWRCARGHVGRAICT